MPRLILAAEQVDDWPTVRECTIVRTGTTRGYTRVAERRTWHPYAGLYGIGYVCALGPHRGSARYQDIIYCIDPRSTSADASRAPSAPVPSLHDQFQLAGLLAADRAADLSFGAKSETLHEERCPADGADFRGTHWED